MSQFKRARKRLAVFVFCAVAAAALLMSGAMMFMGSRLTPIDVSDCAEAPAEMVWLVDRFDFGITVYARGFAMLPGSSGVTMATTALLRDPDTGTFYRIPTGTREADGEMSQLLGLSDHESSYAGFFARGLRVGASASGRELWLLFEDGVSRYLIPTDRSF